MLFLVDHILLLRVVVPQHAEGPVHVLAGGHKHGQQDVIAAVQRQCGRTEERRVQGIEFVLVRVLRHLFVLHDLSAESLIGIDQREQQDRASQVEDRVGIGDDTGVHGLVHQSVYEAQSEDDANARQGRQGFAYVEQDIHDADAPCILLLPDRTDDGGGHAVAQVHADDHGVDRPEGQQAGSRECLQDTDGRG